MKIFGASGHGKVIAEIAKMNRYTEVSFIDDKSLEAFCGSNVYPRNSILPTDELIIAIGDNRIRKAVIKQLNHTHFISLIHPFVQISESAKLGVGVVCMAGAVINADASIGDHVIMNTHCTVDHDCVIGDYVHISPNAALAGNVIIGEGTHVGIGASVIQGVKIGKWATVGAGATIVKDIPDYAVVVGVPGRVIKFNKPYEG